MNPWFLYFITRLDSLNTCFCIVSIINLILFCVATIFWIVEMMEEEFKKETIIHILPWVKRLGISLVVFFLLTVATPTTKEMAIIYVAPKITESDMIQKDIPDLYRLAVDALKEKLQEESTFTPNPK